VGFDPGTVAALAAVDLQGDVVFVKSFRGGLKQAVALLRESGHPSIVASDRAECESVSRLASSFGAVAFFPGKNLAARDKRELVSGYELGNQHEKDALAAALKAYKNYKCLLDRISSREREIFDQLVREEAAHISQAFEVEEQEGGGGAGRRNFEVERRVRDLQKRLKLTEHLLREREGELDELKEKLGRRERPVRRVDFPGDVRREREARQRLEKELMESHGRLSRLEAQLDRMDGTEGRKEREDIRERVLRMVKEYRERFRK